jgi:hypothetical protein
LDFGLRITDRTRFWNRNRSDPKSKIQNPKLVDGEFLLKLDRLTLSIGRDLVSGLMGEHIAVRRTAGIEFADYRQYTVGDDIRRVDWNAYARLGTLHIRQAQAEHDTTLYLLLDASPSMSFGTPTKLHAAKRLTAALGYIALAHLDSVVLAVPGLRSQESGVSNSGHQSPAGAGNPKFRGRAESASLFRYLQEVEVAQAVGFDDALGNWGSRRGQGRAAVVISDLLLDDYRAGLRQMVGNGFQVTLLHLLSGEELRPSDAGDFEFIDSETGRELQVHLGPESLSEYNRRLEAWLHETEEWCHTSGVNYIRIQSDWDLDRVLLETLKRHGVTA